MRKTLIVWIILTCFWPEAILAQTEAISASNAVNHHYAVTLLSSFEPIPSALLPTDLKGYQVYRTQSDIFGKKIYFVRLGFFPTAAEATAMRDKLAARYPGAFMTEVTVDEFNSVSPRKARTDAPGLQQPSHRPETSESLYIITLKSSRTTAPTPTAALPVALKGKRIYLRDSSENGATLHMLQLGFFTSAAEARTALQMLISDYPDAKVQPATAQEQKESSRTMVAVPGEIIPVEPPIKQTPLPVLPVKGSVEEQAKGLFERSHTALSSGDYAAAIQILRNLLRLPPNTHSQDAQELIGLAYERLGENGTAKQEYKLYLRLYPEGPGADRIRQRLAALETPAIPAPLKKPERNRTSAASTRGSLSQHYYHGQSSIDSATTVLGPATSTSLSIDDQSALYTDLDLRGRYNSGNWDNRIVIRDTYVANFLEDVESYNRLYSAYYDVANKEDEYSGRFGRQPGTSGGVLGRFDGLFLGYNVLPKWRVNVVAGVPVEFYPVNYDKQFWGTSLDFGLFANHWNGSLYYIQQTVDGIADRQAIGTELRFFDPKGSALLYVDHDILFSELNIATFQATWLSSPSTTWNTLLDHRLAPTLMTSNALFNAPSGSTIESLLTTMTQEQLRQQAITNTPTFDTYMLGVSHNLNTTWQVGGDVKRFNLSAPPSSPTVTTILGTGATMAYTVQTIANGLFRKRDLSVLSLSFLDGETYQGTSLAFTHRMLFQDRWTLDLALSYYLQQGEPLESIVDPGTGPETHSIQTDSNRITPAIRISYRWGKNITFETEFGTEKNITQVVDTNITSSSSSTTDQDTSRRFFMLGYRWDF